MPDNNKGIKQLWGHDLIDSKARNAISSTRSSLENDFQKKTDDTLGTTDKTVPGAINEIKDSVDNLDGNFSVEQTDTKYDMKYNGKTIANIGLTLAEDQIAGGDGSFNIDLTPYQTKNDDTLTTTNKTIVGGINEINTQCKDIVDKKIDNVALSDNTLTFLANNKNIKTITLPSTTGGTSDDTIKTISSKVLATVPASDIKIGDNITINNISINKDRRYYIEFLSTKKLCSLLVSEELGNCIICTIGGYSIQVFKSSTNIMLLIELGKNDITTVTFTDLVIYEEEVKYLDSKYLETDLTLQNSISLGRVGDIGPGSSAVGMGVTASGTCSHAEGMRVISSGDNSHAEGNSTKASGVASHAEGNGTTASGGASHAEGGGTTASGDNSHAEGNATIASGDSSHAEGNNTQATSDGAHAEGDGTIASGNYSHAEGSYTTASGGFGSHAEGSNTTANGIASHSEGDNTEALGNYSHAEGSSTIASGNYSHAEGSYTTASGKCSHVEGGDTKATGDFSHAEGSGTIASGDYSHSEGSGTTASSQNQHVQGKYNIEDTNNKYAHIVGNGEDGKNSNAHTLDWQGNAWYAGEVQGTNLPYTVSSKVLATVPSSDITLDGPVTINNISINKDRRYYIEFLGTKKLCSLLISEEWGNCIICSIGGYTIQAFTKSTNVTLFIKKINKDDTTVDTFTDLIIYEEEVKYLDSKYLETDLVLQNSISLGRVGDIGEGSSAIGIEVEASGMSSHAEGGGTTASGDNSHAEGNNTKASGVASHAEGNATIASGEYQHVQGKYNIEDTANKYAHIVGNGNPNTRANAHTLDWQGNAWYAGKLSQEGTPTEDKDLTTKKYVDNKVSSLPQFSFNENGELVVTINGVSKTFVPKE